tara:strand:+ start:355 stop:723 length:369 start_codon:yes stop_codon:yes gene_type:complete
MNPEILIEKALEAQKNSQCKYSNFPVGCALLTNNNEIIMGCNIESAAYPSTICAERVAIFSAISRGIYKFKAIAIVSPIGAKPCGQCRQIMHEYLGNIPIYVLNNKKIETHYIKDLLPHSFG